LETHFFIANMKFSSVIFVTACRLNELWLELIIYMTLNFWNYLKVVLEPNHDQFLINGSYIFERMYFAVIVCTTQIFYGLSLLFVLLGTKKGDLRFFFHSYGRYVNLFCRSRFQFLWICTQK
jgi:hypothetical protein